MKSIVFILLLMLAASGCVTKSRAQREAQAAFQAGQNAALKRQLAQSNGVTVVGPVQNPQVPWVVGLTLTQAIATANYLGADAPKEIIITRQGENATIDPKVLINGAVVPLEQGDVIELR